MPPLQLAFLIVGALSVLGLVIFFVQNRRTFAGYEEFSSDGRKLGRMLRGECFRDGDDLVMAGNYNSLATVVRFSNSDNTPGLNVRVQAPANFSVSVTPVGAEPLLAGRVVSVMDPQFESRFTVRSDRPTEARMFLSTQQVATLKKLSCSSKTHLTITIGSIELNEMVIPGPDTARHVTEHLKQISTLVAGLRTMPDAHQVKLAPIKYERHWVGRAVLTATAIVTAIGVFGVASSQSKPQVAPEPLAPAGMLPVDAAAVRDVKPWRVATAADFHPVAQHWLRDNSLAAEGRVTGVFIPNPRGEDAAYLLVRDDGTRRVVVISAGNARYDAQFSTLGGIARLPKDGIANIEWQGKKSPAPVDGDGLLLIRDGNDPTSALALFFRNGTVVFGSPAKYDSIALK
jgi:hypothetical protein